MRINNKKQDPITFHDEDLNEVEKFVYLGSASAKMEEQMKISRAGSTRPDMHSTPFAPFGTLQPSPSTKRSESSTPMSCVQLYGSETWRTIKSNIPKLQIFIDRCLRNIITIRWPDVISNTDLWDKTGQSPIEVEIRKRKWGWIGDTLRKSPSNVTKQALDWNPQGKRKVGRPKQTWRRSTDAEVKAIGMTWAQLRRTSRNRVRWRSVVAALCSSGNQEA